MPTASVAGALTQCLKMVHAVRTMRECSIFRGLIVPQAEWLVPDQGYFALDKDLGDLFIGKVCFST